MTSAWNSSSFVSIALSGGCFCCFACSIWSRRAERDASSVSDGVLYSIVAVNWKKYLRLDVGSHDRMILGLQTLVAEHCGDVTPLSLVNVPLTSHTQRYVYQSCMVAVNLPFTVRQKSNCPTNGGAAIPKIECCLRSSMTNHFQIRIGVCTSELADDDPFQDIARLNMTQSP